MLPVSDRGATRSGKTYLPEYISHFPQEQQASLMEKYKKNQTTELNTLFAEMSIIYPTNYATEYSIDCDLIQEVSKHAFARTIEEDPQAHLMFFDTLCGTFKIKDVSLEFVLLRLFKFSLKDDAEIWYNRLPYCSITSWKMCAERFMDKFLPCSMITKLRRNLTSFVQEQGQSL